MDRVNGPAAQKLSTVFRHSQASRSVTETPVNALAYNSPFDVGKSSPCGCDRENSPSDVLPNTEDGKVVPTAVFEGRSVESKAGTAGANVDGSSVMSVRSPGVWSLSLSSVCFVRMVGNENWLISVLVSAGPVDGKDPESDFVATSVDLSIGRSSAMEEAVFSTVKGRADDCLLDAV
ncbi:uncharacterized protein N7458_005845 [Penicillium daleae]|uniref:Uncharacterized protein n=1 Tax=Penicillium daleae TaxID=63821 RepID=A0AAD6C986_9EURO|nr:uncharacterized protein N7458_005845 [Penicillium daleae]KAJ5454889.1 hypothetical protein N7458_005845 [Penicillium daleae]